MSWPSLQRYWRTPENQPSTFVTAACDEFIIVNNVSVVEKEVVFACQFNLDLVDLVDSLSAIQ